MSFRDKYFGDRNFYRKVLLVAVPIMIQHGITNFVGMLDNIMIGQVGTQQMSGASIVNQLIFVYNLCIFGGVSGAGIFTAQYYGQGDHEGVKTTFRYKLLLSVILTGAAAVLFVLFGDTLIGFYLTGSGEVGEAAATLAYGKSYMLVMLAGLPAFMLTNVYTSTLRECGETILPMNAGVVAVLVNLVFNYILIFGHFGFPKMGVVGAAVATVISRYVEMLIVVIWTHVHPDRNPYIKGIYRRWGIPKELVRTITVKGFPLLLNEALWSSSQAILVQCYAVRGLTVVAALNIASTITNLFNCVFLSLGSSVAIIVGQLLGAGRMEEARDTDNKMIAFSIAISSVVALAVFATAPFFPRMYNTEEDVRHLATLFMMITAVFMPQNAFMNATYFTLRSGGKTMLTFLFDSVNGWVISIPIAFILSRFTGMHVALIMVMVMIGDWGKCILGFVLVKKGIWMQNIVGK